MYVKILSIILENYGFPGVGGIQGGIVSASAVVTMVVVVQCVMTRLDRRYSLCGDCDCDNEEAQYM